jgi:hypothetical protein
MYAIHSKTMKGILLTMLVTIIMISTAIAIIQQYPPHYQTARAYPCIGDGTKEYCTGYHDGAVQAYRDYKIGHDLVLHPHPCKGNSTQYCNGYNRGYSDEADFLG